MDIGTGADSAASSPLASLRADLERLRAARLKAEERKAHEVAKAARKSASTGRKAEAILTSCLRLVAGRMCEGFGPDTEAGAWLSPDSDLAYETATAVNAAARRAGGPEAFRREVLDHLLDRP